MLRNWVNLLLMAAAAALLLVASGVPAASAMAHGGAAMAMQSPCGAMDMGGDTDTDALPSPKAHCAVGCLMSPSALGRHDNATVPAAIAPCSGQATALRSAPLALDPPPPRPRSPPHTQIIEWR